MGRACTVALAILGLILGAQDLASQQATTNTAAMCADCHQSTQLTDCTRCVDCQYLVRCTDWTAAIAFSGAPSASLTSPASDTT